MVVEQALQQVKGKNYTWTHFLPEFSLHLKKKKKDSIPFSICNPLGQALDPS